MSISVMKKLTVICPSESTEAVVKRLVRQKCVQVECARESEVGYLLENLNYDTQRSQIQTKINKLSAVLPVLVKYTDRGGGLADRRQKINREEFLLDGSYASAWEAADNTYGVISRIAECKAQVQSCTSEICALSPWLEYGEALSFTGTKHTDVTLGTFPVRTSMDAVSASVEGLLCSIDVISEDDSGVYVCVFSHKECSDEVMKSLSSVGFLKTQFKGIEATPKQKSRELQDKKRELLCELGELDKALHENAKQLDDIEVLWDIEQTNLVCAESITKMGKTDRCSLLSGWVPEQSREKVCAALEKFDCAYGIYDAPPDDEPPIYLDNNKFARNFEWVVGMYSYPKYGSFDPTFIMSIFYFFMFGLMFADVGYGLLVTLGGLLLPKFIKLSPGMKRSFYMFGYCGISSMIMGVIFGGWFGDMPYAIMQNFMGIDLATAKEIAPIFNGVWFNPIDDPMTFLIVSLAVGGVHLIAGMIIQFVILCKKGEVISAIFDIGSWWVIFAGIGVIFIAGTVPGLIVCGVGVLMIVLMKARDQKNPIMRILKGLLGLYDITSYASDLLSYSRILALGLASAVIAQVINLIGTMAGASVVGFIAFVAAFLIGHTLNLAINVLGAFVHTSRLQYLEFFGKFYEDGGREFKAVEPSEKYTID